MLWKRLVFAFVVFLLFFAGVEGILWAAGGTTLLSERDPFRGFSDQIRVFVPDRGRGVYRTDRRATRESFNHQEFALEKPENGFRIFVLGGSSAYGFPWTAREAFTRMLGRALQSSWPERKIEAVNAAAMSYGSHRLRILAHELLEYEPDVLVVYGGHNEFVERRFYHDMLERGSGLDPVRRLLYRWRLFSLMVRIYEKAAAADDDEAREPGSKTTAELLGLDVVRDYSSEVGEAEKSEVRGRFEENLRAILDLAGRAGVPVVLCTVPSNVRGWRPNQSFFGADLGLEDRRAFPETLAAARDALQRGEAASAVEQLEKLRASAPGYAEVHFQLGRAYEALGRRRAARDAYVRARDTDGRPSRAPSELNETIRRLGTAPGAILVDVERAFEEASPDGILGFNLFEDYVHPKPEAHRRIAFELWRTFLERGLLGEVRKADPAAFWTAVDEPGGPEADEGTDGPLAARGARTTSQLFNLGVVLENQGLADEAIEKYRACVALNPLHYKAQVNIGRLLLDRGDLEGAEAAFRRALEVEPRDLKSLLGLAEALRRQGRLEPARELFLEATSVDPRARLAWTRLGDTLVQEGRYAEAESAFRRAAEIDPGKADAWKGLGHALLFSGKLDDARAAFGEALAIEPDDFRSLVGMAAVLTRKGELVEAERLCRESLRIRPGHPLALGVLAEIEKRRPDRSPESSGP